MSTIVGLVLVQLLSQAQVTKSQPLEEQRQDRRTRAAISAIGGGLFFTNGAMPGFGLSGEVGLVFKDRISGTTRFSFFTNIGGWDFSGTLGADYTLSDYFGVGLGATAHLLAGLDSPAVIMVMAPVRLTFSPFGRSATAADRSGLLIGLEAAAGSTVFSTRGRFGFGFPVPVPVFTALLTVGYAVW